MNPELLGFLVAGHSGTASLITWPHMPAIGASPIIPGFRMLASWIIGVAIKFSGFSNQMELQRLRDGVLKSGKRLIQFGQVSPISCGHSIERATS